MEYLCPGYNHSFEGYDNRPKSAGERTAGTSSSVSLMQALKPEGGNFKIQKSNFKLLKFES